MDNYSDLRETISRSSGGWGGGRLFIPNFIIIEINKNQHNFKAIKIAHNFNRAP